MQRPVVFWRSARRHRIGRAHARWVMRTTTPVRLPATATLDARLLWIGTDSRGLWLEVLALDLPEAVVVIHVMPLYRGGRAP